MKTYMIKEIFGPTLQGEGSHAGRPVKFLRFAGCNKWSGREADRAKSVCWYCDTDFVGGSRISAAEIIYELEKLGPVKTVVISGGEPTLQLDVPLLEELRKFGYETHLETNGSNALGNRKSLINHITMSPKQEPELTKLEYCHDLKILFPYIRATITPEAFKYFFAENRFLQPVHSGDQYEANLARAVETLYTLTGWRLSLQLHKILGVK